MPLKRPGDVSHIRHRVADRANSAVTRRCTGMASQPRLGLLSKWWARISAGYRPNLGTAGPNLVLDSASWHTC
jgi:hypothetical protein